MGFTNQGRPYFINYITKTTQWEDPRNRPILVPIREDESNSRQQLQMDQRIAFENQNVGSSLILTPEELAWINQGQQPGSSASQVSRLLTEEQIRIIESATANSFSMLHQSRLQISPENDLIAVKRVFERNPETSVVQGGRYTMLKDSNGNYFRFESNSESKAGAQGKVYIGTHGKMHLLHKIANSLSKNSEFW